jgi:hypothetical protein
VLKSHHVANEEIPALNALYPGGFVGAYASAPRSYSVVATKQLES